MNYELVEEWGVMLLYMLCAGLAFGRFRRGRCTEYTQAEFWLWLSVGLAAMGINKVADFQTPFIDILRYCSAYFGLEAAKSSLRVALFGCLGLGGASLVLIAARRYQMPLRTHLGLVLGITCLLLFYMIRTASIVGVAFKDNFWFNSWPLEVASLMVIAAFALRRRDGSAEYVGEQAAKLRN